MADSTKVRILTVFEILSQQSNKEHPLSSSQILEELKKYGIEAERKSIYNDIEALQTAGIAVVKTSTPKKGFYLSGRTFELPEVQLLADAVQSAGFIPKKSTERLVGKLQGLVSRYDAEGIKQRVCIENRSKSDNEAVYENIEFLISAIDNQKKVKIKYKKHRLDGNKLAFTVKEMTVSPYALMWQSDRYYLIGNNSKYDNIMHLRVDRIEEVSMTREKIRHFSEVSEYSQRFDVADYSRKTFNMFGGEKCRIDLECKIELLDQIVDKFTDGIFVRRFDNEPTFRFSADAMISEGLVGWIMQFGGDIKVLSPERLKQSVLKTAEKLVESYKNS